MNVTRKLTLTKLNKADYRNSNGTKLLLKKEEITDNFSEPNFPVKIFLRNLTNMSGNLKSLSGNPKKCQKCEKVSVFISKA